MTEARWFMRNSLGFWFSEITISRRCRTDARNRKMEHMPNMTVIGNAFTCNFFIKK